MKFDPDFYLDDRIQGDNLSRALEFIHTEYIEKEASVVGREAARRVPDFRHVLKGALDGLPDEDVFGIIRFAVMQRRNYLKVVNLRNEKFAWGYIWAITDDADQFMWCQFAQDKYIELEPASIAVATFVNLSLAEQRSLLKSAEQRAFDLKLLNSIENRHMTWPDVIPGHLHFEGLGVPPFHRRCTCIVAAAIAGASDHEGPAHEVERLRRLPKQTMFKITVKRE